MCLGLRQNWIWVSPLSTFVQGVTLALVMDSPYTKGNHNTIRSTVRNKDKYILSINVSRSLTHYHAHSNESIKVSYLSPPFFRPGSPALLLPSWELGSCTDLLASPSPDAWVCPIIGLPTSESYCLPGFSTYSSHPLLHFQPQYTQVWAVISNGPKINEHPQLVISLTVFPKDTLQASVQC